MESVDDRTITVSEDTARLIRGKVSDGSFASAADVVGAAMEALIREAEDQPERIAMIKARIKASMEDTRPGYSSDEMKEHFRSLHEKAVGKRHDSAA